MAPIDDLPAAIRREPALDAADYPVAASQSFLPLDARQVGAGRAAETYPVRGLDDAFLGATTFALGARARGYASDGDVWRRARGAPGLAVVDATVVPRRDNFNFSALPSDFRLAASTSRTRASTRSRSRCRPAHRAAACA